jgi:hypothetical protein
LKFEITVSRKVQTFPYESLGVTLTQQFDDSETPLEAAFIDVRDRLDQWVKEESERCGARSPEPREKVLLSPNRRPRDPILDMSQEPQDRRRFR